MNIPRTKALVLFTAITAAASVSTASAQATVAPAAEEHCVIETAPPKAGSDELQIVATSCFDRFDDVLEVLAAPQEIVDRVDQPDQLTSEDKGRASERTLPNQASIPRHGRSWKLSETSSSGFDVAARPQRSAANGGSL